MFLHCKFHSQWICKKFYVFICDAWKLTRGLGILHTPGFNLSQSIIFWVEVRVQSINLISATCNGLCCSPETEEQLRHQARADFHDLIHHHSRSLQGLLATTADALRGKSTLFYCHKWSDCTLSYGTLNLRSHGERHSETGKTIRAKMYVCNGWLIDSLIIDNLVAMVASRICFHFRERKQNLHKSVFRIN